MTNDSDQDNDVVMMNLFTIHEEKFSKVEGLEQARMKTTMNDLEVDEETL